MVRENVSEIEAKHRLCYYYVLGEYEVYILNPVAAEQTAKHKGNSSILLSIMNCNDRWKY